MKSRLFLLFVALSIPIACSARKGFAGLALTDAPNGNGVLVNMVKPGAPADRAGIRAGDLVVAINGSAVDRAANAERTIGSMSPNQTANLSVLRWTRGSAHRLTIPVILGSSEEVNSSGTPTSPAGSTGASTKSQTVSGYVRLTDPLEQAFTVEVPSGWRSEGGLARRSALQINPYVRSLSPDKMTYLLVGEPTMVGFTPPSQMGNAIGHPEGTRYDAGLGGIAMVLRYLPGAQFARAYGQGALQGLCGNFRFSSARDRPDLARKADAVWPTIIPSRTDGGEAHFSCTHNKQEMEVRVEAVTRNTRDNIMWNVILLQGFIAPKSQADAAEATLTHVVASFNYSQSWIARQNNLSAQAAGAINRRMEGIFSQQRAFMAKLNSMDESFESMDELVSGFSSYRDEKTGNTYSLSNANPNKWTDEATGRIISTPTNIQPLWGSAYTPLTHMSQ